MSVYTVSNPINTSSKYSYNTPPNEVCGETFPGKNGGRRGLFCFSWDLCLGPATPVKTFTACFKGCSVSFKFILSPSKRHCIICPLLTL